jgi:hypothetical protein
MTCKRSRLSGCELLRRPTSSLLSRSTPASALPCPAGRSVPGRGGPERRRRPRPYGTGRRCRAASAACQRRGWLPRTASPFGQSWSQQRHAVPMSSSPAVPLSCHSQESRAVPSGQPRTTPRRSRPAAIPVSPRSDPARSGFGSRGSLIPDPWGAQYNSDRPSYCCAL